MRFSAAPFPGRCRCGASYAKGTPTAYDGAQKATVRCAACPDLTPAEQRDVARLVESARAAERAEEDRLARAREAAGDLAAYIDSAGPGLGTAIPLIAAHPGILADCARHRIDPRSLISALVMLAVADGSRAACTPESWEMVARQCAEWGLVPTSAQDTPVYVFCRDTKSRRLSCERTRWGYAEQIVRALPDASLVSGWTFPAEALLGDLAARIRARNPGAQEEADKLRADLERRAGALDADQMALAEGFRAYFDEDRPFPVESRPALARAGKTADGVLRDAYRAIYAGRPLDPDQRDAVMDARMDLDATSSSLSPPEESLLAALRLPGWHLHPWYQAAGPAEERSIEWSPPSYALWSRPPMDPTRITGVPSVWWARLTFTDGGTRREIGFEFDRDRVYERACAGKTVVLTSSGLLQQASEKQTPWLTWHGEMGAVKAIRELLKSHPTLLTRLRSAVGAIEDEDLAEDASPAPLVGVEHLRAVRQIAEGAPGEEIEPMPERVPVERTAQEGA